MIFGCKLDAFTVNICLNFAACPSPPENDRVFLGTEANAEPYFLHEAVQYSCRPGFIATNPSNQNMQSTCTRTSQNLLEWSISESELLTLCERGISTQL